jgi:hypothetical protein
MVAKHPFPPAADGATLRFAMDPDAELLVIFGVIHIVGLSFACALLWHFAHSEPSENWSPPDEDGGGGGGNVIPQPPRPTRPRGGGLPLPDAVPARVRLREPGRISDARPARQRRPAREPGRTPERV